MFPTDGFSLRQYAFSDAWNEVKKQTQSVRMPRECTDCPKKQHCSVCAAACIAETGASDCSPDYVCRMTAEYDRLLCEKYKETKTEL
jgi:hypothetical protein